MFVDNSKKSVLVGMSGGVDSSTVAAILKNQGYNVVGVTLQLYDALQSNKTKACCGSLDIYDAKKVASQIKVPHYTINYTKEFKNDVIDNFVNTYKKGQTPIPCIRCNQSVKFRDMMGIANDLQIDYIATGHYAKKIEKNGEFELHTSADINKDQTYFLFATTQFQLSKILFPLGDLTKDQTRKIARDFKISVSEKSESQDICFIPDGNYGNFLSKYDPNLIKQGDIVDKKTNKIIGNHKGAVLFTRGQRRKIGIGGNEKPLYVIDTDIEKNIVYTGEEDLLFDFEFTVKELNFINSKYEKMKNFECEVVLRALQGRIPAFITRIFKDEAKVKLKFKGRAITKGQACVFYEKTMVIGGGFIS